MRHPFALGALALATAGLIAGCGSSSSSSGSKAASTPSTAASSAQSTTPAASSTATELTTKPNKLGTILAAGPKKLTVYMFEADKGSTSSCSGACAKAWPPVTASAEAKATSATSAADLSTITRSDGTKQLAYKGHPLYFFEQDKDSGDAYGQGVKAFGADWYVLKPSGEKIDES